jgi:hypothetical protein
MENKQTGVIEATSALPCGESFSVIAQQMLYIRTLPQCPDFVFNVNEIFPDKMFYA